LVAHFHFLPTHKPMLKNAKELPSQRTTTRQTETKNKTRKKGFVQQAVWQNGGFGAFLEGKVLNQSSGIFSNFGAENPPLRQATGTLEAR